MKDEMILKDIPVIRISEIQPGYLLFLNGQKFLAKRIKEVQAWKFGKKGLYFLNHVGFFDKDIEQTLIVYEQDSPGRFGLNRFNEEYLLDKQDVYVGIPKIDLSKGIHFLRKDAELLTGEDCLLNYSYKSFIGFITNALWYKLFKKEIWITGQPKGTTCSQITAQMYQRHFRMFMWKDWYKWYPAELAMSDEIQIMKLIYNN